MRILGISAYYHDSAVCLVEDGRIVFAAQEERYSRIKHDASFPIGALQTCLKFSPGPIDKVVYYEQPLLHFERLLETAIEYAPRGYQQFIRSMPVWAAQKLLLRDQLRSGLKAAGLDKKTPIQFTHHHLSHAASAFLPSPFQEAAILTIDGVGEWATATIGHGIGNDVKLLREMRFPHSLGLFYSAFTYFLGFRVNEGEYKLMGLAPYGRPESPEVERFKRVILSELIALNTDGSITLKQQHYTYTTTMHMVDARVWERLLGLPKRAMDAPIDQRHCDLALAVQQITEEAVLSMAKQAKALTGCTNLCMAGGVALNCVANAKLRNSGLFDKIWIQPAAGDAGGALGAAMLGFYADGALRKADGTHDLMQGARLGDYPSSEEKIPGAVAQLMPTDAELCRTVAGFLADGKTVGWVQGRMEFGPRALGGRSILADARVPDMQKRLNLQVKFRESFRPFAPVVPEEAATRFFVPGAKSPYMLFTDVLRPEMFTAPLNQNLGMEAALANIPSTLPAITHVDGSARVQTVAQNTDPLLHQLLLEFEALTGMPVLVNTSFNLRDEPIVCTAANAYRTFMLSGLDVLVVGRSIYAKADQPTYVVAQIKHRPKAKEARQQWYSLGAICLALCLINWKCGWPVGYFLPVTLAVGAAASTQIRQALHTAWMALAHTLGRINGAVLLTALYGLFILPLRAMRAKKAKGGRFGEVGAGD